MTCAIINIYQHTLKTKEVMLKPYNIIRVYEVVFVKYRCPNTSSKILNYISGSRT